MLSGLHTWSLTAISMAAGVALLWAFRRFSDQPRIELAKRKLRAHLYAFRLYADEPALIWRAQKQLLLWNARYMGLMLKPAAVVLIPTLVLLVHLDAVYGRRPLRAGEAALVTAEAADGALVGRGMVVETPPVRLADEHASVWRARATGRTPAELMLQGTGIRKSVACGTGLRYLPEARLSPLLDWLHYPRQALGVTYPPAEIEVLGFGMHWLIWFLIVSSATMLALRRRFGVTF